MYIKAVNNLNETLDRSLSTIIFIFEPLPQLRTVRLDKSYILRILFII